MNNIVKKIKKVPATVYDDIRSYAVMSKSIKRRHYCQFPIRVGFIVQVPEVWEKEVDVFNEMASSDKFCTFIFIAPDYDHRGGKVTDKYSNSYFEENYPVAIRAGYSDKWIDLRGYKLDYVFYQRPSDNYLPEVLQARNVSKYCKCCYIPYGFSGSDVFVPGNTNRYFFRYIYFSFMESEYMVNKIKYVFAQRIGLNNHYFECLGYPSIEKYLELGCTHKFRRILWTPRWSYDPVVGGSHFLEYKDTMISLIDSYKDIELTIRPHPLMFEELISIGKMTSDEVDKFKQMIKNKGIVLDLGKPIFQAIAESDVLITDYSSIIIEYFATGRPIIYCDGNIQFNDVYNKIKGGVYIVKNKESIRNQLDRLLNGDDNLEELRCKLISEYLNWHTGAAARIMNRILVDYTNPGRDK